MKLRHALLLPLLLAAPALPAQEPADPFQWLEEVEGARSLEWVQAQNEATLAELEAHPAYRPIYERTLQILNARERIANPDIRGEWIYNFWQDEQKPRGVWRRTGWDSYLSESPRWETVLDVDSLARAESVPWSWSGATCLPPEERLCLVRLSRGGADAVQVREFDTVAKQFVPGGFFLPEGKQSVAWRGADALLVGRDFGPGTMTTSGYARSVRLWRRGTPLESAATLMEIPATDMGVWAGTLRTADRTLNVVFHRPSFFESTVHVLQGDRLVKLDLPLDADLYVVRDQMAVYLRSPWEAGGRTHAAGSLVAMPIDRFLAGERDFQVVVQPDARSTIQGVSSTRDHLLVEMLNNVRGELRRFTLRDGRWTGETVPAPELGSVYVTETSPLDNRYFFTFTGFTQPTTLYLSDGSDVREVRRLPEMFDASNLVVEQFEAASRDGTRIPYFVVRRRDVALNGENPTLLYAYGGFEVAQTPAYSATVGSAWLERGGVYVVANIRGGGEFGPAWHRAGLKENRQRVFDDFIAVAEDLIARRITSPRRLGIMGGSNGGLLVGVALTQRPELFNAVVVQVPLLDMRRYNQLLAGASWMAEYGNPDVPEEWAYIGRYSPYHNVRPGQRYPRVLFYTTTRDDRVHPGHARKMAALMESMGYPVYYFENTEGGHGSGVTSEQRARMYAITYTYLVKRLVD
ncbi:MAG: prolyl oligopeptidase family serine peptidase [Gemmatimonadetes bacterium]|nr:prolyl oligopeptidase family serine peptidase [Gemmatimonadota bacterium]